MDGNGERLGDHVERFGFPRGEGGRGEGATLHPKIYNVFFLVTLGY